MNNIDLFDCLSSGHEVLDFPFHSEIRTLDEYVHHYPYGLSDDFSHMVKIEKVTDDRVDWTLNLEDLEGHFGSVILSFRTIKHGEKYKYKHEFVSKAFSVHLYRCNVTNYI